MKPKPEIEFDITESDAEFDLERATADLTELIIASIDEGTSTGEVNSITAEFIEKSGVFHQWPY